MLEPEPILFYLLRPKCLELGPSCVDPDQTVLCGYFMRIWIRAERTWIPNTDNNCTVSYHLLKIPFHRQKYCSFEKKYVLPLRNASTFTTFAPSPMRRQNIHKFSSTVVLFVNNFFVSYLFKCFKLNINFLKFRLLIYANFYIFFLKSCKNLFIHNKIGTQHAGPCMVTGTVPRVPWRDNPHTVLPGVVRVPVKHHGCTG